MPDPFDEGIRQAMISAATDLKIKHHPRGTVITIEGNRFSTRAESHMFRAWGADVINMSIAPECILANEVGIPYGAVAMSTDYDCWKEDEAPVSWEDILEVFRANVGNVTQLLVDTIPKLAAGE
jgi:5'-methylthioadenosine phosphorylase